MSFLLGLHCCVVCSLLIANERLIVFAGQFCINEKSELLANFYLLVKVDLLSFEKKRLKLHEKRKLDFADVCKPSQKKKNNSTAKYALPVYTVAETICEICTVPYFQSCT